MGRSRVLGAGGIDSIAEEPHHARGYGAADGGSGPGLHQAVLACATRAPRRPTTRPPSTRSSPPSARSAASPALTAAVLRPFLDAIRSEDAGSAVASASLTALHEVMSFTGPVLPGASLREVVDAVVSCRFEAGAEPATEDAVLMRMLQALLACLRAPAAAALWEQHVCTA